MASWNKNYITVPKWDGSGSSGTTNSNVINVSSLNANNISTNFLEARSISSLNGSIAFLSNLVLNTGVIQLGITPTILTAEAGVLYVNGDAVAFPSTLSTIADWSFFKSQSDVDMSRSTLYNVQSISTNTLSTGTLQTNIARVNGLSTLNISSANITFDTLNGRAGVINTLSGSNAVYFNGTFSNTITSNVFSRNLFASSIVCSNSIRSLGVSSITISTFLLEANTVAASYGVAAGIVEVRDTLFTKDMRLFDPSYPVWDSNTVYNLSNIIQYNFNFYQALTSNRNVTPGSNIPDWVNDGTYFVNNITYVGGVGSYRCINNISGSFTSPNGDLANWTPFNVSSDGSNVWSNLGFLTDLRGGITGSVKSFISVGSIVVSNANISTLASGNITATSFISTPVVNTQLSLVSTINANNVSTGNITAGLLTSFSTLTQHINLYNGPYTQYDINRTYVPGNAVIYNNSNYSAVSSNRGMFPNVNIPNWISGATYQPFNYAFVVGAGCYRCLNTVTSSTPPNADFVNWAIFSPFNLIAQLWIPQGPTVGASIVGDANSFINIGSINVNNISTGTSINLSNITSYNITNSNNISNGGNFSNAGNANLNTLTTTGQVYTQNILNVQGLMSLQSDMYGQTNDVTLLVPPFTTTPQFLKDILNIREGQFETLNIFGGSTGNRLEPPYRNNSIVNIGTSEICPAVVTIGGVNLLEDTAALTVYGEVNVELGSFNSYYTANFYPLNFEANAINVYGLSYLNGGVTITGFTDCLGTLDVQGITTFTGAVNALGVVTIEGETNIAGLLTAEAGIGVVGAATFQAGDIIIGNSGGGPTNNFNLYCYYNNTDIENLTNNGNADFRQNVNIDGTLTANILSLNSTTTKYANISTLFVSTLIGNVGKFNNLTTSNISTQHISTLNLDALITKGNLLTLQSYNESDPVLQLTRNIDGVEFFEGGLTANSNLGFTLVSLSSLTVLANDDINITSGKNVIVNASTFNVPTSASIYGLSTHSISTNFLLADTASIYGLSTHSISTNFVLADTVVAFKNLIAPSTTTQDIQLFSDIPNNIRSGITGDYLSYIDVGQGRFSTITSVSTLTSSITTNNIAVRGEVPFVAIYKPSDQDNPVGVFTAADGFGFGIVGTENIQILSSGGDIGIVTPNNIALAADQLVFVNGPELRVLSNANISSIQTFEVSTSKVYANSATIVNDLSANNLFTTNLLTYFIGNPLPFQSPVTFNDNLNISGNDIYNTATLSASNISTNFLSTGSLFVNNYAGNSISTNLISSGRLLSGLDITTPAISTTTISSATIFTNFINAPVNVNFGKNIIPSGNLDLGASGGFRWRNLWVSTISSIHVQTSTIVTRQIATDRIIPVLDSGTNTANLYPQSAGSQIGFFGSSGTNSGGFYNNLNVRSTNTQVLTPDVVGAFSNNIRVQGNLSTQNVFVSTINRKLYPYTSTFGVLNSASTFRFNGNDAVVPQVLYSNITFPHVGTFLVSGKNSLSKASGGTGAEPHGFFSLSRGLYASTFSVEDGFSSIPYMNRNNISTLNTFSSEIYVSSMNTNTRFITYTDYSAHSYVMDFGLGQLRATYIPSRGINPE
jgi:hypothetical protein